MALSESDTHGKLIDPALYARLEGRQHQARGTAGAMEEGPQERLKRSDKEAARSTKIH